MPFVNGAARGGRAFFLGQDGWLRGITYRQVWLPGENEAVCMVTKQPPAGRRVHWDDLPFKTGGVWFPYGREGATPNLLPEHEWASCEGLAKDCACGFYAYHAQQGYGYAAGPAGGWGQRVEGIVEAYGKIILGSQGYRAQKARVVAVYLPPPSSGDMEAMKRKAELQVMKAEAQALLDQPLNGYARGTILGLIGAATSGALFVATRSPVDLLLTAGWALLAAAVEHSSRKDWRWHNEELRRFIAAVTRDLEACPPSFSETHQKMRENYPDLAVYTSKEEMVNDWPIASMVHLVEATDE